LKKWSMLEFSLNFAWKWGSKYYTSSSPWNWIVPSPFWLKSEHKYESSTLSPSKSHHRKSSSTTPVYTHKIKTWPLPLLRPQALPNDHDIYSTLGRKATFIISKSQTMKTLKDGGSYKLYLYKYYDYIRIKGK
jgi:hypothetical protein